MAEDEAVGLRRSVVRKATGYDHEADVELLQREIAEQVTHLHQRLDDELAGAEQQTQQSIRDEVARLDGLIRSLGERLDGYVEALGNAQELIDRAELRLSEMSELAAQPRAAERLEARRLAAIEARLEALERAEGAEPDR